MRNVETIFTIRTLSALFMGEARCRRWLRMIKDAGFDAVALDIIWQMVEARRRHYDFAPFDKLVELILQIGMVPQLKLNSRLYPDWISGCGQVLRGGEQPRCREVFDKPVHTFADESFNKRIADFFRRSVEHYKHHSVISYQPMFSFAFENEYEFYQYADYSPRARAQYARWLRRRYHRPDSLNAHWGAHFTKWPQRMTIGFDGNQPADPEAPDCRPRFIDFMKYREDSLRSFIHTLARAVREADENAHFCLQIGHIYSPCAARRGTVGVFRWGADADEIIVDPSPSDDIGFAVDALRASDKICSVELDGPYPYRNVTDSVGRLYAAHSATAARHGAQRLYIANFMGPRQFSFYHKSLAAAVNEFRRHKRTIRPSRAVYLSKWTVYSYHERDIPCYHMNAERGPVDIISDDLLTGSPGLLGKYKKVDVPFAPVVGKNIAAEISDFLPGKIRDEYGRPIGTS